MFSKNTKSNHSFLRGVALFNLAAQFFAMSVMLQQMVTQA